MNFDGTTTTHSGKTMVLDFNTCIDFVELTGKDIGEVFNGSTKTFHQMLPDIRAFYFVCLKRNHPQITMVEAGNEAGNDFSNAANTIGNLFESAMPDAKEGSEAETAIPAKKPVRAKAK